MVDIKQLEVQYVTNQAGEKTAVILSMAKFEGLLEDLEDLLLVAERRDEPTISHADVLAELKRDGLFKKMIVRKSPNGDCLKSRSAKGARHTSHWF